MKRSSLLCLGATFVLSTLVLQADVITTIDGARLTGTITLIDKGSIHIDTPYAGSIVVKQDQVSTFETETPVVVRLESGTVMEGAVESSTDGKLKIESKDGILETNTAKIAATWDPTSEDPEIVRNRKSWKYEAALNLNGKEGNTEKFYFGTTLAATLKGPDDELRFRAEYEQGEENDNKTDDRASGGAGYESFLAGKKTGWYVRTNLMTDPISDIKFRSTSAGGLSYRFINKDKQTLIARGGLGYRFTDYDSDRDNDSQAALDTILEHTYQFKENFYMENLLAYTPAIDDFGDYTALHDSAIRIPVGTGEHFWIRMGIKNEYESKTSAEEKLDTSYYTKLIYTWE